MIKLFNRKYTCQSDDADDMSVRSFGDDTLVRFGCTFGRETDREVFANLNHEQVGNLIELLTEWRNNAEGEPPKKRLWEDIGS